jgi:hypothetical protein
LTFGQKYGKIVLLVRDTDREVKMVFIATVGIHAHVLGMDTDHVFPYAEECWDCGEYREFEAFRHMCYNCT